MAELRELAGRLREVLLETRADWERMPFFVRPMARKGFERRTGQTIDEWLRLADDLAAGRGPGPAAAARLADLAESYRTAPERAARFMRDEAQLAHVRARSREREEIARQVLAALGGA